LIPGVIEGLIRLAGCGYALVIASNQRGIARGLVSDAALREIETALQSALSPHGIAIAGFYYCPHEIGDPACDCRKPLPGLLLRAATELDLDLDRSWMIGDSDSDVEAGVAAGTRTAYLGPGEPSDRSDLSATTLSEAARSICAQS